MGNLVDFCELISMCKISVRMLFLCLWLSRFLEDAGRGQRGLWDGSLENARGTGILLACTARPVFLGFLFLANIQNTSPRLASPWIRGALGTAWAGKGIWSIQHSRACSSLLPPGYN